MKTITITPDPHISPTLCSSCGGECCKRFPGVSYAHEFPTLKSIHTALASGRWTVDWWEGDVTGGNLSVTKYIRPSIKGSEGRIPDPTWQRGACTFHTPQGCSLPVEQRPTECLDVLPSPDFQCYAASGKGKRGAAISWAERQHDIDLAMHYIHNDVHGIPYDLSVPDPGNTDVSGDAPTWKFLKNKNGPPLHPFHVIPFP